MILSHVINVTQLKQISELYVNSSSLQKLHDLMRKVCNLFTVIKLISEYVLCRSKNNEGTCIRAFAKCFTIHHSNSHGKQVSQLYAVGMYSSIIPGNQFRWKFKGTFNHAPACAIIIARKHFLFSRTLSIFCCKKLYNE